METKPTHEQAQLHLQVYDMRREAKLRQARDWFFKNFFVENLDDWMRIGGPGTENGAFASRDDGYFSTRRPRIHSTERRSAVHFFACHIVLCELRDASGSR